MHCVLYLHAMLCVGVVVWVFGPVAVVVNSIHYLWSLHPRSVLLLSRWLGMYTMSGHEPNWQRGAGPG